MAAVVLIGWVAVIVVSYQLAIRVLIKTNNL